MKDNNKNKIDIKPGTRVTILRNPLWGFQADTPGIIHSLSKRYRRIYRIRYIDWGGMMPYRYIDAPERFFRIGWDDWGGE